MGDPPHNLHQMCVIDVFYAQPWYAQCSNPPRASSTCPIELHDVSFYQSARTVSPRTFRASIVPYWRGAPLHRMIQSCSTTAICIAIMSKVATVQAVIGWRAQEMHFNQTLTQQAFQRSGQHSKFGRR